MRALRFSPPVLRSESVTFR